MELTEKASGIYELLFCRNFDIEKLENYLQTEDYSAEDLNIAAYAYIDECINDMQDKNFVEHPERAPGVTLPGFESSHIYEAVELLLKYGLDPNYIVIDSNEECNIMDGLKYVNNGYQGADTLALLLDHGGNPSILLDGQSMVRDINWQLEFFLNNTDDRISYDVLVHYWMVLVGYGARLEKGEPCVDPCGNFDISNLKNHRQYYYGAIHSDKYDGHMEICFFDKSTNWEVARY